MKHLKLFENYSNIDLDYIKELIEDFCLDNNFIDLSHINPLTIHSNVVKENILDKDILHFKCDDSIGILFFKFIFFVKSGSYVKVYEVSSIRPDFLKKIEMLNKKIIRIINKEGYKTWNAMDFTDESKRSEENQFFGTDEEVYQTYTLKNYIQYSITSKLCR